MTKDTAPTSYVIDIDPRSRHLTPQIFLSSEAFASCSFSGPFSQSFSLGFFPLQQPHLCNCYSPTSTVSVSDAWAWPAPRKEPVSRVSDPVHPPTLHIASGRSATRQHPRKRVDLKHPNKPPATASSGRS